ncbi:MAG: KamA family radical SAM protein [Microcoleaceae cyanobacterium]
MGNTKKEEWKTQLQGLVRTVEQLSQYINVTLEEEKAIKLAKEKKLTWGATPYYTSLMDRDDPNCPIRKQIIPCFSGEGIEFERENYLYWKENRKEDGGANPFSDDGRPVSIARQYKDRIAFTVLNNCPVYCQFCFRTEATQQKQKELYFSPQVNAGFEWIANHPEVRDVLVTGGDPLTLADNKIEDIINRLREIPHVEMIRFGSRVPVALPQRISPSLMKILSSFHRVPIWVNTHFNHPKEITEESAKAVYDLLSCGVQVGNQTVLLKGINDDEETFIELQRKLLTIRVRPYYLFYCEAAPGAGRFMTPVERGAELIQALRGHTTGLAQPMYVLATRIGKINLGPDSSIVAQDENHYTLKNHRGETITIPIVPR